MADYTVSPLDKVKLKEDVHPALLGAYSRAIMQTSGLQSYWRLDESSGTKFADVGPNHYDGTISGSPTFGQTPALHYDVGTAVKFNGTSHSSHGDIYNFAGKQSFSVEFWIKKVDTSAYYHIVGKANDGASTSWSILHTNVGDGDYIYFNHNGLTANNDADTPMSNGQWYYVVFTLDGTNVRLYIDGVLIHTASQANDVSSNSLDFRIASTSDTLSRFTGTLDEVAVYNTTLSLETIRGHYEVGLGKLVLTDKVKLKETLTSTSNHQSMVLSDIVKLKEVVDIKRTSISFSDILKLKDSFTLSYTKVFSPLDKILLRESISILKVLPKQIAIDKIKLKEDFFVASRRLFFDRIKLRELKTVTFVRAPILSSDKVKLKESIVRTLTDDFYAIVVFTKAAQQDFNTKWKVLTLDAAANFSGLISFQKPNITADFYAKVNFISGKVRRYGTNLGGYISAHRTPNGGAGDFIKEGIGVSIGMLELTGDDLYWEISTTTNGTAFKTLERLTVRLAGGPEVLYSTIAGPYDLRQVIYSTKFRTGVNGTYYKTLMEPLVSDGGLDNFSGTFPNLPQGRYEFIVEAVQKSTGNKYIASEGFFVGQQDYDLVVGGSNLNGTYPLQVNLTSSRIGSLVEETKKIIWDFEPGVRIQYGDVEAGRNPSYTYKQQGLYNPIVTYVLENGLTVSKSLSKDFEEE